MSDQLRDLIESVRERLRADLDAQLGTLAEQHNQAVTDARATAEAEADARWTHKLESARGESERLVSEAAQRLAGASRQTLLAGIGEIDSAQSISDALNAIVRAAAREAPRAALFVTSGGSVQEWAVDGASSLIERERAPVSIPLFLDGEQVALLCG